MGPRTLQNIIQTDFAVACARSTFGNIGKRQKYVFICFFGKCLGHCFTFCGSFNGELMEIIGSEALENYAAPF